MNIQINNANLTYVVAQGGQTLPVNVILRADNDDYHAPKTDGTLLDYGSFKGYYVDLTGLYAQGYRKVRFKANKYTGTSGSVMGIVATSPVPDSRDGVDTVEAVGSTSNVYTVEWYELPITANSKCLHACYCYAQGSREQLVEWTPVDGDAEASTEPVSTP
jgi:hypothetical protein